MIPTDKTVAAESPFVINPRQGKSRFHEGAPNSNPFRFFAVNSSVFSIKFGAYHKSGYRYMTIFTKVRAKFYEL